MGRRARHLRCGRRRKRPVRRSRRTRALTNDEEPGLDFDPEHRVGHLLRRAYALAKANTSAGLRRLGITPVQAAAVMAVRRGGPLSQAELGRAIGMQPANVHGLVERLAKSGLIEVAPHATDARQVQITLSARGERHASEIAEVSARSAQMTLAPLSAAERETFLALLGRIAL